MSRNHDLHDYSDIIDLPHHTSPNRPKMSRVDRGAQFSPFAALTGYEAAVEEAARLTDSQPELTEEMKSLLDGKLQILLGCLDEKPKVTVTYFRPDPRKKGGSCVRVTGVVKEIDPVARCLLMRDQTEIPIDRLQNLEGEIFARFDAESI